MGHKAPLNTKAQNGVAILCFQNPYRAYNNSQKCCHTFVNCYKLSTQTSKNMIAQFHHVPVLAEPTIAGLEIVAGGVYLDCTVGGGGHSALILQAAENVRLVGIDRDEMAIAAASDTLKDYADRVNFWRGNFCEYQPPSDLKFDGILADLGVSSTQFDVAERGFSFREAGDLDMRMDNRQTLTAAEIINHYKEVELADIFFKLGEERLSRRIARQIVEKRPFKTTLELANAISACVPSSYRHGRIHPATRTFQALRIAVNRELESLEKWLTIAPNWLKNRGKIAVITFHSLEDRMVKHTFREDDRLQVLTKKVIIATDEETRANPRARSAKLRIAQRI